MQVSSLVIIQPTQNVNKSTGKTGIINQKVSGFWEPKYFLVKTLEGRRLCEAVSLARSLGRVFLRYGKRSLHNFGAGLHNFHLFDWLITAISWIFLDFSNHIHSLQNLSKDDVST